MPTVIDTAYPRLKAHPTAKDLDDCYTPTLFELSWADKHARAATPCVGLLILLKTFQRLGYFYKIIDVPVPIREHIGKAYGESSAHDWSRYDASSVRDRHMSLVRSYVGVTAYDRNARKIVTAASLSASHTRDDLADIINVAIEELVRQRYELPAFGTLLKIARGARGRVNRGFYSSIFDRLGPSNRSRIDTILTRSEGEAKSSWDVLKREPQRPTPRRTAEFLNHLEWLKEHAVDDRVFIGLPDIKVQQFAAEARSLDLASLNDISKDKRYTLAAALLVRQTSRALDDITEMYVRQVRKLHNKANEALETYLLDQTTRSDRLISLLRQMLLAYRTEGSSDRRLNAIANTLPQDVDLVLADCEAHEAVAGKNYLPFLGQFYSQQRANFFRFLENVTLIATSQDRAICNAIEFLLARKISRQERLSLTTHTTEEQPGSVAAPLDISWVQGRWWPLVTGTGDTKAMVEQVDRRYFELCLFTQIMQDLKSGDLAIAGSDQWRDWREQLVTEEEHAALVEPYCVRAGIPREPLKFVVQFREELQRTASEADRGYPNNVHLEIENGVPFLKRLQRKPDPEGRARLELMIKERLQPTGIMEVLVDTEHWLRWTRHFGPISGHDAKLIDPIGRYVATTFCYGFNFGPTQTARSVRGLDRRQVSFVNQRHVTEQKLNEAIDTVIDGYKAFPLPEAWGLGKTASADGTQWDLYPQNLMSEYHIRYGDWGGLGFYLVADNYIALFSRFSTCGSWEGHYILDFVTETDEAIQPDVVHADTQGQSAAIFGLAHLLGIQLMPRIRNWKDLHLFRSSSKDRYEHIDSLFTKEVDWDLIAAFWPDMLRVAVSIAEGRITPSTILRRLATHSRKNKLYFAFRELGCVVRTAFLLRYLSDIDLRHRIQTATNKSEAFNKFAQWAFFAGGGVIAENLRDEQRKVIKYNHLATNLLIYHNVVNMSRALARVAMEGHEVSQDALATISPYQTEHVNRYGSYKLRLDRIPEPLDEVLRRPPQSEKSNVVSIQAGSR